MSLGNWYWTFQDNQVVSYSTVDNIKNISLHEDVCASLFRNVNNNNPVTRRHIQAVRILNAADHIQNGTGGLEAGIVQKEPWEKILKEYLEINMRMWDGNIKMDIKENSLFLELILHHNSGRSWIFGKFIEVILHKNNKHLQKFCNWSFLRTDSGPWFTLIGYFNFLNCWKAKLCLKRENTILLTQNLLRDAALIIFHAIQ